MNDKKRGFYMLLCVMGILLGLILLWMSDGSKQTEQTVQTQSMSSGIISEPKVARMLEAMEDVKSVSVMLQVGEQGQVVGVAVVCENGENPVIQEKITRVLRALYGLGAHQISVSG